MEITHTDGGVLAAQGFVAAAVASGVKKSGRLDLVVVAAEKGAVPASAVFTQSSTAAPPVSVSREAVDGGRVAGFVVNAGNANACTGKRGLEDARAMADVAADALGCEGDGLVVASTGVIGVPLPVESVLEGIRKATAGLSRGSADDAAQAIMTTDTFAKQSAVTVTVDDAVYTVGGMAKGSGMIMPNMATMLGFITTDAPLSPAACEAALASAVEVTFNRITVDGDTSTNDMVLLMASGAAAGDSASGDGIDSGDPAYSAVAEAIRVVCTDLARMIVRDGEGATKFIEVTVRGAESEADAREAALSIANSPLFKTAVFGGDANWGRVAMAVGKSSARVDPDLLEIEFAGIVTCRDGMAVPFDEERAAAALAQSDVDVVVDLHIGQATVTVWTCDLSYEYVRINGDYRT